MFANEPDQQPIDPIKIGRFTEQIRQSRIDPRNGILESDLFKENPYYSEKYEKTFRRSLEDPDKFWGEIARELVWTRKWDRVVDNSNEPFTKWFVGGELNACYNCVDRHVELGNGDKVALIHDSPITGVIRKVTYSELYEKVSALAGALASYGVTKGDRVLIYMPLVPEVIIAMLATARLGAVHSVVFGGFAARELCSRIEHAEPKVLIAASCGVEPNKIVRYKSIVNEALRISSWKVKKCVLFQRRNVEEAPLDLDIDVDWDDALRSAERHPCVPVESNDPLYILYTSGTTDKPKGIQRPTGGHLVALAYTMKAVYGMGCDDVWWSASDLGWVVGHSYICYAPLLNGITSIMYEGKPDRSPDPGQYFRIIQNHRVNAIFTVPTAFRVIKREDPEIAFGKKYNTGSLRHIFVAGEHCDYETKEWAEKIFRVPILNHWWQTETGHSITATCVGLNQSMNPPKYAAGMPFPGYDVRILREDSTETAPLELGRIVIKLPLPPGNLSTLYQASARFCETYFSKYPGFYDTMDAGYRDEYGYIYVTSRDDDVINVAGHRLSTSALEDVCLKHPDVADAAVIGVPESTKGEIPLCLYVLKRNVNKNPVRINKELVALVRELIGPIAAFKLTTEVEGLPRTRSGKTCRKSIADLARGKQVIIPSTIEDPTVYVNIKAVLQTLGYALNAPDPK